MDGVGMSSSMIGEVERNEDFFIFTRNNIERKIRRNQVTLQRLSSMFEIDPSTLYLVEEFGETAEFPNNEGKFHLQVFRSGSMLRVEGRPLASRSTLSSTLQSPTPMPSTSFTPLFRSVIPSSSTKKKNTATIKVTLAENLGGKVVNSSRQTYILVDESSANVNYIQSFCRQEFEVQNLVLVSPNGLKIEDCEATRGLNFWKATSRKVYCVPDQGKGKNPKRKKSDSCSNPSHCINISDDEFETPQETSAFCPQDFTNILKPILSDTISSAIKDAFKLGPHEREVFQEMVGRFTCLICRDVIQTDVIVGTCCGAVVGCKTCLDSWYEGNETCPKCRDIRGHENCITLRGLGDVLEKAAALTNEV